MTRTFPNRYLAWIATSVLALALGATVCANAFAQSAAGRPSGAAQQNGAAPRVVAGTEDMRLWSFGDCDRRFPYTGTPEHKACVRVVGSPEAVEARTLRVCDVSHAADKEEAERCKSNYKANKLRAAQEGVAANAPVAPHAPPSDEVMRRVKAIGTAALEEQRAATVDAPESRRGRGTRAAGRVIVEGDAADGRAARLRRRAGRQPAPPQASAVCA
jgi:hypothetical protein